MPEATARHEPRFDPTTPNVASRPKKSLGTCLEVSSPVLEQQVGQPGANLQPTYVTESENTGSDWLNEPSAENNRCAANSRSGAPCAAFAHTGSRFCIFHDPAYRETQRANSAFGGRRSGEARARTEVLGYVLSATLQGRYSNAQSAAISRMLAIASRNQDNDGIDPEALAYFLGGNR